MKRIDYYYMIDGLREVFHTLTEARSFIRLSIKADDQDATKLKGLWHMKRGFIIRKSIFNESTRHEFPIYYGN